MDGYKKISSVSIIILFGILSFNSCKSVKTTSISLYESSDTAIETAAIADSISVKEAAAQQDFTDLSPQLIDSLNNNLFEKILNYNSKSNKDLLLKIDSVSAIVKELQLKSQIATTSDKVAIESSLAEQKRTVQPGALKTTTELKAVPSNASALRSQQLNSDSMKIILNKLDNLELRFKVLDDSVNALSIKKKIDDARQELYLDRKLSEKSDSIRLLRNEVARFRNIKPTTGEITIYETNTYIESTRHKTDSIKRLTNELNNLRGDINHTSKPRWFNLFGKNSLRTENREYRQSIRSKTDSISELKSKYNKLQLANNELKSGNPKLAENDSIIKIKNDSIILLKEKVQLTVSHKTKDSLDLNNEISDNYAKTLSIKSDSIQLLINQIYSLNNILTIAKEKRDLNPLDSTLFVASYRIGSITATETETIIENLKELIQKQKIVKVLISGFTDISGTAIANKRISDKRINVFRKKLVALGVNTKIIYTQSWGSTYASKEVIDSERRVEILVFYNK